MISNETESSTMTVTNQSSTNSTVEMSENKCSNKTSNNNENDQDQNVQNKIEQETQENEDDQQQIDEQEQQDDDFIRITAAHQILNEAQACDDQKNYPAALHLYRICVDLLLEELMFTEGTEQSRVYLREKCTAIMDHIDHLKTKLDPITITEPVKTEQEQTSTTIATATTENQDLPTNPPTDQLNALHLS